MDILMTWLGENYTAYVEAKLAKAKDTMLAPLAAQIVAVGFLNCKPRDLRLYIKRLESEAPSPYLRKFESVLQTIFSDGRRETRTRATRLKRRKLSTTARKRPEIRANRGEDTTQVLQAASDSDHVSASIKTESGFQDGSEHAPLAVYDDDEDESLSTALPIGEIYRRAALFDARLKFGRKKTLSQAEIDQYFPKPET